MEYILGLIVLLLIGRETYNLLVKRHLESKLNDAENALDKERLSNATKETDQRIIDYHAMRDAWLERNKPDSE